MIIDCSVGFGHWPFARFTEDTPRKLDRLLMAEGIDIALVSAAEAILFEEPEECNADLRRKLKSFPRLVAVPVVNPRVKSAAAILSRPGLRALKLIPNYHAYSLCDEKAVAVCACAADLGIPVLIQLRIEDERSHYELLKVPGVPVDEVLDLSRRLPSLAIVALCPYLVEAVQLAAAPRVYVDISFAENIDTLGTLLAEVPAEKVLFGSHAPWLYPRAAAAKLRLSNINDAQRTMIAADTAARLFGFNQ